MTTEEQRLKRRDAYKRKKECKATLGKYAEFAAYIVDRKKEERDKQQEASK